MHDHVPQLRTAVSVLNADLQAYGNSKSLGFAFDIEKQEAHDCRWHQPGNHRNHDPGQPGSRIRSVHSESLLKNVDGQWLRGKREWGVGSKQELGVRKIPPVPGYLFPTNSQSP